MKEECKQEPGKEKDLQLEIMALDLNSLKSVVDFVEAFKEKGYQLNVLICNAGLGMIPQGRVELNQYVGRMSQLYHDNEVTWAS